MIVFHGSSKSDLKELVFKEENSRFLSAFKDTYGCGIFLAEQKELASSYAMPSLYTVKINSPVFDNTNINELKICLNELENELSIPNNFFIKNNLIFETIELISKGQLGQLFRQLQLIIDSDYDLYQEVSEFAGEDFSELIDSFEKSWLIKYPVYKYHDTDIGNIFICYDYDGKPLEIIDEEIINN